MPKQISVYDNASFSELEWTPGELVAFDNTELEAPSSLLLTIPKKIIRGHYNSPKGFRLIYSSQDGEREEWT